MNAPLFFECSWSRLRQYCQPVAGPSGDAVAYQADGGRCPGGSALVADQAHAVGEPEGTSRGCGRAGTNRYGYVHIVAGVDPEDVEGASIGGEALDAGGRKGLGNVGRHRYVLPTHA